MADRRRATDVTERIAVQHRVALGLTALTLGGLAFGLSVALLATPGNVAQQLFSSPTGSPTLAASTATAITLTWTAPGDDGMVGQASSYDLRYSRSLITENNFSTATRVVGVSAPQPANSTETYTVSGLQPDTTYYFALKTADEAGNVSNISNPVSKKTDALPQACVPQYECTAWSACTNGKQTKSCSVTNGCPSGLGQPVTEQPCTAGGVGGPTTPVTPTGIVNPLVVAGVGPKATPKVRVLDGHTLALRKEFAPYAAGTRSGVFVVAGDVDGDQRAEVVVSTGAGSVSTVRIFTDTGKRLVSFNPYGSKSKTGVTVAVGDVNGDARDEIITAPASGAGVPQVYAYNPTTKKAVLLAKVSLTVSYRGGYNVAAGDLTFDGRADIIIARRAGANGVSVYTFTNGKFSKVRSIKAYPISFRSGVVAAAGDINGDGRNEIVTIGGQGYWSDIKIFTASGSYLGHFLPFARSYFGGGSITTRDVNDDGVDEILVAPGAGATPFIRTFRYNPITHAINRLVTKNVFPLTLRVGLQIGGK